MDPLALLPYALAAAGGRINDYPASALVAAGVTLLQRSAPLVRALAGRRAAVLLPPGPAWLVALAASDGRGLVVLEPGQTTPPDVLARHGVGALFTTTPGAVHVPDGTPVVLLDEAPRRAQVRVGEHSAVIDLGSHFALDLAGDSTTPGAPEECLVFPATETHLTHAQLLLAARTAMEQRKLTPLHHTSVPRQHVTAELLVNSLFAPLLVGGTVATSAP